MSYLKSDAPGPETRTVDPYVVAYAEGTWYVVGYCHDRQEGRVFRIDRILEAEVLDEEFQATKAFDPNSYLSNGRVFRADEEIQVPVRYSPPVARWLIERGEGSVDGDGNVVVRHQVADPGWLVRHVLQYGPDAEVLEPVEVRELVTMGAKRVISSLGFRHHEGRQDS